MTPSLQLESRSWYVCQQAHPERYESSPMRCPLLVFRGVCAVKRRAQDRKHTTQDSRWTFHPHQSTSLVISCVFNGLRYKHQLDHLSELSETIVVDLSDRFTCDRLIGAGISPPQFHSIPVFGVQPPKSAPLNRGVGREGENSVYKYAAFRIDRGDFIFLNPPQHCRPTRPIFGFCPDAIIHAWQFLFCTIEHPKRTSSS